MNIDIELTNEILRKYNNGEIGLDEKVKLKSIPRVDNKTVIDFKNLETLEFQKNEIEEFFTKYEINSELQAKCRANDYKIDPSLLEKIGINLYPYIAFGVLNGGSATSYVDYMKNRSFSPDLFDSLTTVFENLSIDYKNKPKGITPAFTNPNGTSGPSFMELKMRSLLLEALKYEEVTQKESKNLFPLFQMTSTSNDKEISEYYKEVRNGKYLKGLIEKTGIDITSVKSGIQPLIAAFTHSKYGDTKEIFKQEDGKMLPLPGGHGQCFYVLKDIFKNLYNSGIRFITIGNVDNIGYTVDPKALAILAITGKQATFDFSFKTSFDVKGGVLIKDQFDRLNCADLGVAVSKEEVTRAEESGIPILFNCATGMFNLEYLINNIDYIVNKLPTRFSDQSKDAGDYSQAEQVTWEVMSLLDDFLILAVDKYERFLASKLLLENLVTSGLSVEIKDRELKEAGELLNRGLNKKLQYDFNLKLENGEWKVND